MAVKIRVHMIPSAEFVRSTLYRARRELGSFKGLWEELQQLTEEYVEELFSSHGFGEWEPLADSTLRYKSSRGYPSDPLIREGSLRASFRARVVSSNQMWLETTNPAAQYHEYGTSMMVARPMLSPFPNTPYFGEANELSMEWAMDIMEDTIGRL